MPSEHIGSAQHEFKAHLWYLGDLTPYWTLSGAMQGDPFEGSTEFTFDIPMPDGRNETWEYQVYYQKGSLAPRPDFGLDEDTVMREWRLKGRGPDRKKASFHIKPRWEDQRLGNGDPFKSPWMHLWNGHDASEGVEVTADGSNVEPDVYPHLLDEVTKRIAVAGGSYWSRSFFCPRNVHRDSPITTCERYFRIETSISQKLIRQDGYFGNLGRLLTGEQGTRFIWDGDNTECLGYLHTFRYNASTARDYLPGETYGKQLKHYYPQHVGRGEDDPLAHPKVGALFKQGREGDGTMKLNGQSIRWGDRDDLLAELEETLINTLENADIPTDAPTSFVGDDHFQVEKTDRRIELHPDPTPAIEHDQEASVAAAFREMTDSMQDVTEVMADGGQEEYHIKELAEKSDRSVSTIYRVLERMHGVLENENGIVRWASRKAAKEIRDVLSLVTEHVGSAVDRVGRLLGVDERAFAKASGRLQTVAARHGLEFGETADDRLQIRVKTPTSELKSSRNPHRAKVANEIGDVWLQVGRQLGEFMRADIVFANGDRWRARSLINEYRNVFETTVAANVEVAREPETARDRLEHLHIRDLDDSGPPA